MVGFIIHCGSIAFLIVFINAIPLEPSSSARSFRFPRPMPCSPVHVPPNSIALRPRRSVYCFTRGTSLSTSRTGIKTWKLPSPTCPITVPIKLYSFNQVLASSITSGSFERGTQTSVMTHYK